MKSALAPPKSIESLDFDSLPADTLVLFQVLGCRATVCDVKNDSGSCRIQKQKRMGPLRPATRFCRATVRLLRVHRRHTLDVFEEGDLFDRLSTRQ